MLTFRPINVVMDRNALLEWHCDGNYESETPWARRIPYEEYRKKWMSTSQPESFISHLAESTSDARTIAEIVEKDGTAIGYVWVTFTDVEDYAVTIAEVNDIAVSKSHRRARLSTRILEHVEHIVRECGADLWRSGTGIENVASADLHEKMGFKPYRIEYEKVLSPSDD